MNEDYTILDIDEILSAISEVVHLYGVADPTGTPRDVRLPVALFQLLANLSTDVETDKASDTKYPSVKAVYDYVVNTVAGLWDDRGNYDASVNTFPASGGSGTGGTILKGDIWTISVAGTLGGENVEIGDTVRALIDTPGQTASNWSILQKNLDYVSQAEVEQATPTENSKITTILRAFQGFLYWIENTTVSALNTTSKNIIGAINELIQKPKAYQTISSSSNVTAFNVNSGLNAITTLTENTTITFSNLSNGDKGKIVITQGSSNYTVDVSPSSIVVNGIDGITPVYSGTGIKTILSYSYDGTNLYIDYNENYKGYQSSNVFVFDAKGDNSDQTTEIQAAISALGTDGTLIFNAGKYIISSNLNITSKGKVKIIGNGAEIIGNFSSTGYKIFNCTTLDGLTVEGLNINLNNNNTYSGYGFYCIDIEGVVSFTNCQFYNFGTIGTRGMYLKNIGNDTTLIGNDEYPGFSVMNCKFFNKRNVDRTSFDYSDNNALGFGIQIAEFAEYWRVIGCSFKNISCGLYVDDGGNGVVFGNEFNSIDGRNSKLSTTPDYGAIFFTNSSGNSGKTIVVGNQFNHMYAASIRSLYAYTDRPLLITNNEFLANSYDSIIIEGTDRTKIHGNFFNRAYDYIPLTNYPFTGTRQFILLTNTDRCQIFNNDFLTQTGNGITSTGTSDYNKISENTYNGISGSFTSLAGSNNILRNNDPI